MRNLTGLPIKAFWVIALTITVCVPTQMAFAQDGSFTKRGPLMRRFGPARQDNSIQWDLMNKPGDKLKKTEKSLFDDQAAGRPGALRLPNGSVLNRSSDGSKTILDKNGGQHVFGSNGSAMHSSPNGSNFWRQADGTKSFRSADGKESILNPDGTGTLGNGTVISKNAVDNSTSLTGKGGLGLQSNQDGSMIFKRSNGLETVRTPDGKIYMRDSKTKQPTGFELKK